jgi:hypothetical protein
MHLMIFKNPVQDILRLECLKLQFKSIFGRLQPFDTFRTFFVCENYENLKNEN